MSCKTLFALFAFAIICNSRAADSLYLTGWAQFGGVSRAMITRLPENQSWIVRSDLEIAGFRLERLDVARGRAWVKHGNDLLDISLVSSSSSDPLVSFLRKGALPPEYAGTWPGGYEPEFIRLHRSGWLDISAAITNESGRTAAARYIGALRAYARTLPESERGLVDRELFHYSAGALQPGSLDPVGQDGDAPGPQPPPLAAAANSPAAEESVIFLKKLLASAPPELGSLIGAGLDSEVPRLRRLLLSIDDPVIQLRVRQQLDGYSAPPIAPYARDKQGNWFDSNPVQSGG